MKIRTVSFDKTIGMPNFSNDRPGIVYADLEEGETKEEAWSKLNQDMIAWHKKEYPHLYPSSGLLRKEAQTSWKDELPPSIIQTNEPEERRIGDLESDILSCQSVKVLETYKLMVRAKPDLQKIYDTRLKQLTNV